MSSIHPSAIVHPGARLGSSVEVGPCAVIDEHVEIGPECVVGPHVYITGATVIGARNRFHAGSVIGDAPQDLKYSGALTGVQIGNDNVFREHVTVHRSTRPEERTSVGSNNFLMANAHVAHNCNVGNHVILANGALLGGHAVVEDRVFISGNCLIHQFTRIGALALMQGGAGVSKDVPPFTISAGINGICGLNTIGLRRAGFTPEERLELKALYHALFRSGRKFSVAVEEARATFTSAPARQMLAFIAAAKRGVCPDASSVRGGGEEE